MNRSVEEYVARKWRFVHSETM